MVTWLALSVLIVAVAIEAAAIWALWYRCRWLDRQLSGFERYVAADPAKPWPPDGAHFDDCGGLVWE